MEIQRRKELEILRQKLHRSPAVALLGPRQCGKTTLARQFAALKLYSPIHFFDLEKEGDLARLDNPLLALEDLQGLIVIDEVQFRPNLFPTLRVLIDQKKNRRFLILGSASQDLLQQGSESLAGRLSFFELGGFTLDHFPEPKRLWLRGAFPLSFLASKDQHSLEWRLDFIRTFLERDIPRLGIRTPARTLRQLWMMLAHYHGQLLNTSELGRSLGFDHKTIKRYLDLLSGTFMVRQIQPWFYNTKKRIVKSPKIFFRDSGILHALFSITGEKELLSHPKMGASWEGFALEQVIQKIGLREEETFFWGIHAGGDLDLVFQKQGRLWGVEVKYHEAPKFTPSMALALRELSLAHLWVVYPGKEEYPLEKKAAVVPIRNLPNMTFEKGRISRYT